MTDESSIPFDRSPIYAGVEVQRWCQGRAFRVGELTVLHPGDIVDHCNITFPPDSLLVVEKGAQLTWSNIFGVSQVIAEGICQNNNIRQDPTSTKPLFPGRGLTNGDTFSFTATLTTPSPGEGTRIW